LLAEIVNTKIIVSNISEYAPVRVTQSYSVIFIAEQILHNSLIPIY